MIDRTLILAAALALLASVSPAAAEIHDSFDELLAKHVANGSVDYAGFQKDEAALDSYLAALGKSDIAKMTADEKMAFWINAYNAFTIKLILNHYPGIESIKDIPRGDRWNWEGWVVSGEKQSLDAIEHELLRPLGDPRIHFAINCASFSCPDLIAEAYRAETLDEQLDRVTRAFFANEEKGLRYGMKSGFLSGESPTVQVSEILFWFREDFESDGRDRVDFLLHYAPKEAQTFMAEHRGDLKLKKLDYDWSLNDK
ncbi:MAG: DUF547 domain-containing protein [Gemmatimonadetes bacterium]|nr:DUF547 domain-containing protein [Gemmatimonadota bacterium]